MARFERALLGPSMARSNSPFFFLPVAVQDGDRQLLRFVDEHCELHGDYDAISQTTARFPLDDDGREVFLYGNGMGTVALADPWRDRDRDRPSIAEKCAVPAGSRPVSPVSAQLIGSRDGNSTCVRSMARGGIEGAPSAALAGAFERASRLCGGFDVYRPGPD